MRAPSRGSNPRDLEHAHKDSPFPTHQHSVVPLLRVDLCPLGQPSIVSLPHTPGRTGTTLNGTRRPESQGTYGTKVSDSFWRLGRRRVSPVNK